MYSFSNYSFRVDIEVRRRDNLYYAGTPLAGVKREEDISCDNEQGVYHELDRIVEDALYQAHRVLSLRNEYEEKARAFEDKNKLLEGGEEG